VTGETYAPGGLRARRRASSGVPAPASSRQTDLAALPRDSATATDHGATARYVGVRLARLLAAAGVWPAGDAAAGTADRGAACAVRRSRAT
jgi:hypothetical protein